MAEFKKLVITTKGQALMAKLMTGTAKVEFTKISVSDTTYTDAQLEGLTSLSGVKQSTLVSKVTRTNNVAVQVEGAVTNTDLTSGYYMRTIGLYALDPDEGEILYAVTNASQAGYMPPYNGITVSGAFFKLVTTVSNADNVTLEVDQAAVATIGDIKDLQNQISDLQGFVGYTDNDIYGIEVDFQNYKITRLAGAENRTAGAGFDEVNAFGGRKRCILADDGTVLAYHGEPAYTETGKLTQEVTVDETTYPVGTQAQVMVEQPRFYYRVIPLKLDKVVDGKGHHMRKARYYVADTMKTGFKVHPAFIRDGKLKNFIYLSAYEGCAYDVSVDDYIKTDEQIVSFVADTGDKLSSIANVKPMSGLTQTGATRNGFRTIAQNRGPGWEQLTVQAASATQLLFAVEYASFNTQTEIGFGVLGRPSGEGNESELTGATTLLGNKTGEADNDSISYRGEENWYGNIWKWTDGVNVEATINELYIADHGFADNIDTDPYENAGFTIADGQGYISAFGYSEDYDWLFFASEFGGNSSVPVGDYNYNTNTGWRVARLGGTWNFSSYGGGFCWSASSSSAVSDRSIGGRLVYVPGVEVA